MNYTYSFEKLNVWQKAVGLTKNIYLLTANFPKSELYGLTSQMRRCSISIASNISEGSARKLGKDQARFSQIAYSSAVELLNQLIIANKLEFISEKQLLQSRIIIEEITKQLAGLKRSQLSRLEEPEQDYQPLNNNPSTIKQIETELIESSPQQSHISSDQPLNPSTKNTYFFHYTANIDDDAIVGKATKIWHFSHIMTNSKIGNNCSLGQNVFVASRVILGDNVKVQNNVSIYEGVVCEDNVFIGPSVVFTNVINPRASVERKNEYKTTKIGIGASIGANATIVCGNNVGQYAFVGAGSVITKDVLPYALVVGNPAKQIGWVSRSGQRLNFDPNGEARCNESYEKYVLRNDLVYLNPKP